MNRLDALKAALEAKREAEEAEAAQAAQDLVLCVDYREWFNKRREVIAAADYADDALHAILTDDTIAALIAVAKADDPEPERYDPRWNHHGETVDAWVRWEKRRAARATLFPKEDDDD